MTKDEKYKVARKIAQDKANETGYDHGLEWNSIFLQFNSFMLPAAQFRSGHELRCEVVSCMDYAKIKPGHGGKPLK